jgi:peroxiredoxin
MSKIFTANFLSFLLIVQIMCIDSSWLSAQTIQSDSIKNESTVLQGLKKAGPGDIEPGTPLMLDPMSMPMYDEQFQKINPADFMKIMMSSEYIPEPYLDEKKMVKAFVLRKATLEEKAMMAKMQQGGMGMEQEKNELIGTKATDFNLKDLKGKTHLLSELKGKVVVLNFWFVECKPCIMEMPELNELVEEFKEKNIVFLAIALNDKKELKKFLKTTDFNYKVVANGQTSADSYGVKGFPTNVIIDQNGIIHYVSTGIGPNNKENLQKAINELLNK